jgi:hypothetical protein
MQTVLLAHLPSSFVAWKRSTHAALTPALDRGLHQAVLADLSAIAEMASHEPSHGATVERPNFAPAKFGCAGGMGA